METYIKARLKELETMEQKAQQGVLEARQGVVLAERELYAVRVTIGEFKTALERPIVTEGCDAPDVQRGGHDATGAEGKNGKVMTFGRTGWGAEPGE
jgi:hypothetical protein